MWQKLIDQVDSLVDGITMYRLLLYYLLGLLIAAIGLSAVGDINYNAIYIAVSAGILVAACWIINKVLAYLFDAPVNPESSILTGLILALIISPDFSNKLNFLFLLAAAGLAMGSKYVLTYREKHLFNPAAVAIVLTALGPHQEASWWVGTAALLPFVIIGGVLVMRKVRREHMVIAFWVATTVTTAAFSIVDKTNILTSLREMVLSSAMFYLGFVMLTEPYTSPTVRKWQLWYAAIVGVILAPQFHIGHYYSSPEVALIAGNIFAFIVSPKTKLFPRLREKVEVANDTADFVFVPDRPFTYKPGQYMEFTLPHTGTDNRGSRRYFTIASSPTEKELRIGVKFYDKGSSFKEAMLALDQNSAIVAAQLSGDFVMPDDQSKKLAFIAGGVGITPFRSMVKYLVDTGEQRDVTLLYSARTTADFAYVPIFEEARRTIGLSTIYTATGTAQSTKYLPALRRGAITAALIQQELPDYAERTFYISGTHRMVVTIQDILRELGVPARQVKTDFFPGYA
ncbi:MAG TPA: RnfABCDGE type electron transport complex subunit D [Candidatus Saccharimonadales bacterium]|nr:RnfABCDGE type electron transport complex subunit D [Candidatus Saccharimonadales bacterium]